MGTLELASEIPHSPRLCRRSSKHMMCCPQDHSCYGLRLVFILPVRYSYIVPPPVSGPGAEVLEVPGALTTLIDVPVASAFSFQFDTLCLSDAYLGACGHGGISRWGRPSQSLGGGGMDGRKENVPAACG